MNLRGITALFVGLLSLSMFAAAVVRNGAVRITVLDSETHSVSLDSSGVPKNCDGVNFDAYCLNSKTVEVTNTLLVQEGSEPPYRVSCAVDSKWSRCMPLLKGTSYDAKHDKHGLIVYYVDDVGKVRKQLYTFVEGGGDSALATAAKAAPTSPAPASGATIQGPVVKSGQAPAPEASRSTQQESVKCSFTSAPAGAEVTVDGRYVGSTPSVLSLSAGNHAVEVSLPGFATWKRDLTVSAGAELTVNAVLQKAQ